MIETDICEPTIDVSELCNIQQSRTMLGTVELESLDSDPKRHEGRVREGLETA